MGASLLQHALSERGRLREARPEMVLAGLRGGRASLVTGTVAARLVTVLDPGPAVPPRWSLRWGRVWCQARRSALVVAPQRPPGVAAALRLTRGPRRITVERDGTS